MEEFKNIQKNINSLKVNNDITNFNNKKIIHENIIKNGFFNCLIIGKKGSGKTLLLKTILENIICDKTKNIVMFSRTCEEDEIHKFICKKYEKEGIKVYKFSSFNPIEIDNIITSEFDNKNNKNYFYCKNLIIYDDFRDQRQNKYLTNIFCNNRHIKTINIYCSQYFNDINKEIRLNTDLLILFGGISIDKLKDIYNEFCREIEFEDFKNLYYLCTKEKYNFMYLDVDNQQYRKNLNKLVYI